MSERTQIKPVDIQGGKFSYGQRIELGGILADEKKSPGCKYTEALQCLYPDRKITFSVRWMRLYEKLIEGLKFWIEKETTMLDYQPSADELAAGIKELGKKLGPMSTVMTLAEKFGCDPDEILRWEYGKVFGLLYADLENYKFQKRYHKVIENREKTRRLSKR